MKISTSSDKITIQVNKHQLAILDYALGRFLNAPGNNVDDVMIANRMERILFAAYCQPGEMAEGED